MVKTSPLTRSSPTSTSPVSLPTPSPNANVPRPSSTRSGDYGKEGEIDADHPEIHAAVTAAVFRDHSQAFVNLSMHEQRLYRILRDASKSLEDRKARRIAARQAALDTAREQYNLNKMLGVPNEHVTSGFVFTPEEIDIECRRHLLEAKIAQECHYDRKIFRQQLAGA